MPTNVAEVMRTSFLSVEAGTPLQLVIAAMDRDELDEIPVAGRSGMLQGMVKRRAVERCLFDTEAGARATAGAVVESPVARATRQEPAEAAVEDMLSGDTDVLPVVSPSGQLEGLLVFDDLRQVPDLVDTVVVARRQQAAVAAAAETKVSFAAGVCSAVLGVALFMLWVMGPFYGLPNWLAWTDAIVVALAFVGAGMAGTRDMLSAPLWAAAGIGLLFAGFLAHTLNAGAWWTAAQFALGATFLLLVVVSGWDPRGGRRMVSRAPAP